MTPYAINEDEVRRVLAAENAVEIWNGRDAVLREAARRSGQARNPRLRAWIAARLRYALPPEQYREEFGHEKPEWPRAVPFPVADRAAGAMAFVSADPECPLPESPDAAMLIPAVEKVLKWFSARLGAKLRASAWSPAPAYGESVGLAALTAGLAASLQQAARNLAPFRWPHPLTGALDLERGALKTVAEETFPHKCDAARRLGFTALFVASGQGPRPPAGPRIVELPQAVPSALRRLLEELAILNPSLYGHFDAVQKVAEPLGVGLDGLHGFLPGVLARLADPREIASLRGELGLSADRLEGTDVQRWRRLVDEYVNSTPDGRPERRMRMCHLMLERHADDRERSALSHLAVFLNKREHLGELPADKALEEIDRPADGDAPLRERWLRLTAAANCVIDAQRERFVHRLVERRAHEWTALAATAATRLYGWGDDRLRSLRERIGRSLGSSPLPPDAPLRRRVAAVCRSDFPAIFGEHERAAWRRRLRARRVAMCRWTVTNAEYRCFAPGHVADPRSPSDDGPVVGVAWYEAFNFAFWAGLSLPTRLEWLSAAVPRGWASPYPFLDSCPESVNYGAARDGPRGCRRGGHDAGGWVDLFGNVWEWVEDWCPARAPGDEPAFARGTVDCKMAMGGGWKSPLQDLRLTTFCPLPPAARLDDVGFRCVELL